MYRRRGVVLSRATPPRPAPTTSTLMISTKDSRNLRRSDRRVCWSRLQGIQYLYRTHGSEAIFIGNVLAVFGYHALVVMPTDHVRGENAAIQCWSIANG